jgi:hypothetical protein
MNCSICDRRLEGIEVGSSPWAQRLAGSVVCSDCLEEPPSSDPGLTGLPRMFRSPDISDYSEGTIKMVQSWANQEILSLTLFRERNSPHRGQPLAAWGALQMAERRPVRWALPDEVPGQAAVLSDFDLVEGAALRDYAARILAAKEQGIPLLLVASCTPEGLPQSADGILSKIAVAGEIAVV